MALVVMQLTFLQMSYLLWLLGMLDFSDQSDQQMMRKCLLSPSQGS